MPQIDRRTFLRGSAATAGAMMLGGPFQGSAARAANAATLAAPQVTLRVHVQPRWVDAPS